MARSCSPMPTELKRVICSGFSRPATAPAITWPSSPATSSAACFLNRCLSQEPEGNSARVGARAVPDLLVVDADEYGAWQFQSPRVGISAGEQIDPCPVVEDEHGVDELFTVGLRVDKFAPHQLLEP